MCNNDPVQGRCNLNADTWSNYEVKRNSPPSTFLNKKDKKTH